VVAAVELNLVVAAVELNLVAAAVELNLVAAVAQLPQTRHLTNLWPNCVQRWRD
jgi:hypothetical protein